ncbi:hypothetical protein Tco_0163358 [Tanacetum coccineum]
MQVCMRFYSLVTKGYIGVSHVVVGGGGEHVESLGGQGNVVAKFGGGDEAKYEEGGGGLWWFCLVPKMMFASADSIKSFLLVVQVTFLLIMFLLVMFSFLLTEIESADYVSAGHVLSDGEQGTVSDHSVNDDPIPIPSIEQVTIATQKTQPQVPKPKQTVVPSCAQHVKTPRQPIRTPVIPSPIPSNNRQIWNHQMEREVNAGYSFVRKPCFVCGSLSHLIKDCDYYEKKMARETALKRKRVVITNNRQATPAWNNTNRINKANQFTPRPVNVRPNLSTANNTIKTGRVNDNTGHGNVNSDSVHVNAVLKFFYS